MIFMHPICSFIKWQLHPTSLLEYSFDKSWRFQTQLQTPPTFPTRAPPSTHTHYKPWITNLIWETLRKTQNNKFILWIPKSLPRKAKSRTDWGATTPLNNHEASFTPLLTTSRTGFMNICECNRLDWKRMALLHNKCLTNKPIHMSESLECCNPKAGAWINRLTTEVMGAAL